MLTGNPPPQRYIVKQACMIHHVGKELTVLVEGLHYELASFFIYKCGFLKSEGAVQALSLLDNFYEHSITPGLNVFPQYEQVMQYKCTFFEQYSHVYDTPEEEQQPN